MTSGGDAGVQHSVRPVYGSSDRAEEVLELSFFWLLYHHWGVAPRILIDDKRFYPHLVVEVAVFFDLSCMPTNAVKSSCVGRLIGNFPKHKQNE